MGITSGQKSRCLAAQHAWGRHGAEGRGSPGVDGPHAYAAPAGGGCPDGNESPAYDGGESPVHDLPSYGHVCRHG